MPSDAHSNMASNMPNDDQSKASSKKSTLDRVIMGAIIGTAIGSAIGMSVAPKKGSETREIAKETGLGLWKLAKGLIKRFTKKVQTPAHERRSMKEIPNEMEILPPEPHQHE